MYNGICRTEHVRRKLLLCAMRRTLKACGAMVKMRIFKKTAQRRVKNPCCCLRRYLALWQSVFSICCYECSSDISSGAGANTQNSGASKHHRQSSGADASTKIQRSPTFGNMMYTMLFWANLIT